MPDIAGYETFDTEIANGESLSAAIDLGSLRAHRLDMPAGWTAAAVTFQVSSDGEAYEDLYTVAGEYVIAQDVAGAGRTIVFDPMVFFAIRWLKVRSGTAAAPVAQAADRALRIVMAGE
jgi:hypothetical protein